MQNAEGRMQNERSLLLWEKASLFVVELGQIIRNKKQDLNKTSPVFLLFDFDCGRGKYIVI